MSLLLSLFITLISAPFALSHFNNNRERRNMFCLDRFIFFFFLHLLALSCCISSISSESSDPVPAVWPEQFHSILFMNDSKGTLQKVDLWYDWPNGRNFNIIQNQLGKLRYDLEWDNGTGFYYTLDSNKECTVRHFEVGILRPNWLDGATYLGQKYKDGFLCNVWEKVDFIWYYEDVETKRPVYWRFFTGMIAHVMTFEIGNVLQDPNWQAPVYCFGVDKEQRRTKLEALGLGNSLSSEKNVMRGFLNVAAMSI